MPYGDRFRRDAYELMTDEELAQSLKRMERKDKKYARAIAAAENMLEPESIFSKARDFFHNTDPNESLEYWRTKYEELLLERDAAISELVINDERQLRVSAYKLGLDDLSAVRQESKQEIEEFSSLNRGYIHTFAAK